MAYHTRGHPREDTPPKVVDWGVEGSTRSSNDEVKDMLGHLMRDLMEFSGERMVTGDEGNYGDHYGEGYYDGYGMGIGVGGRHFGHGHGMNGLNGGRGMWFQERRAYANQDRYGRHHPTKSIKHAAPEFYGKFDPDAYLEWESQVEKMFSLHNYAEGDKVKLATAEFLGYANTWWTNTMRRKRMEFVRSWEELNALMRATFVP